MPKTEVSVTYSYVTARQNTKPGELIARALYLCRPGADLFLSCRRSVVVCCDTLVIMYISLKKKPIPGNAKPLLAKIPFFPLIVVSVIRSIADAVELAGPDL